MSKPIAFILSVIVAFSVLFLVSVFWVLLEVDGILLRIIGAFAGYNAGTSVYKYFKNKNNFN